MSEMNSPNLESVRIDAKVTPYDNPDSKTKAFVSVTIADMVAINGIRIVDGVNGLFIGMPQAKNSKGEYHPVCAPFSKEAYARLSYAVLEAYQAALEQRSQGRDSVADQIRQGQEEAKEKPAPASSRGSKKKDEAAL